MEWLWSTFGWSTLLYVVNYNESYNLLFFCILYAFVDLCINCLEQKSLLSL